MNRTQVCDPISESQRYPVALWDEQGKLAFAAELREGQKNQRTWRWFVSGGVAKPPIWIGHTRPTTASVRN